MLPLLIFLGLVLLLPFSEGLQAAAKPSKPAKPLVGQSANPSTQEELAEVQALIRKIEKQTREDQVTRKALNNQLRQAETGAALSRRDLAITHQLLAKVQQKLTELAAQLSRTRLILEQQRADLADQLRLAHVTAGADRARAVFNQRDPGVGERHLIWLSYLARRRGVARGSGSKPCGVGPGAAGGARAASYPGDFGGPTP